MKKEIKVLLNFTTKTPDQLIAEGFKFKKNLTGAWMLSKGNRVWKRIDRLGLDLSGTPKENDIPEWLIAKRSYAKGVFTCRGLNDHRFIIKEDNSAEVGCRELTISDVKRLHMLLNKALKPEAKKVAK